MRPTTQEQARMLANRLKKNERRIGRTAHRLGVHCYRLYDADIPEIPLYIDRYEGKICVSILRRRGVDDVKEAHWTKAMIDTVSQTLQLDPKDLFLKVRRRQKGPKQYEKIAGRQAEFTVRESDMEFVINLSDYLDTGLFLDHRITREMVRGEAANKRVLNLFAYTGTFSVYAAAGGARSTTTVDMSNTYLKWAKRNMEINGFSGIRHEFVRADILSWLEQEAERRQGKYDLVVFDPPTFSKSKKMSQELDIQRDHSWMLRRVMKMTSEGGVIYFSTNFRDFRFQPGDLGATTAEEITKQTLPFDFQHSRPHRCWRITL